MSEERLKRTLVGAGAVMMLVFCLFPFVHMTVTSFSKRADFLSEATPYEFTLDNYRSTIATGSLHFMDYLRNSLIVSTASAICCVLSAAAAAYAVTRLSLPGKVPVLLGILALSMFPQISMVSYLFKLMTALGWVNTHAALVLPCTAWILPLSVWILVSYFLQIPQELDRAALVDGCTRWQIIGRVIFPLAKPGLCSALLLAFIFTFNEFMFALMLTSDHHARTVPVGIALFQGLHGEIPWGTIMAASTVTTIPIVILTVVFQRHIIQGLTRGAVKG